MSYCKRQEIAEWVKAEEARLGKTVRLWYRGMVLDGPVAYRHAWDALKPAWEPCFGDRRKKRERSRRRTIASG